MASNEQSGKLSETERSEKLKPLTDVGWKLVNDRDAIQKKFEFKNFNQVRPLEMFIS